MVPSWRPHEDHARVPATTKELEGVSHLYLLICVTPDRITGAPFASALKIETFTDDSVTPALVRDVLMVLMIAGSTVASERAFGQMPCVPSLPSEAPMRAPSRLAASSDRSASNAKPNSRIAESITASTGTIRANSTRLCPRCRLP